MTDINELFADSYDSARSRFLELAAANGWRCESHLRMNDEFGTALFTDVAIWGSDVPDRLVVVSSGLHGVEGFFGGAVQCDLLRNRRLLEQLSGSVGIVLVHALNPYGFSHLRRFDEHNIDPNRNFLFEGECYAGVPEAYCQLDSLLNPRVWPRRELPFHLQACWHILKRGLPALKQAIASGQYEFPRGLFFGGQEPGSTLRFLDLQLDRWMKQAPDVMHLDLHTGLGRAGTFAVLLDHELTDSENHVLRGLFGDRVRFSFEQNADYQARGTLSRWLRGRYQSGNMISVCAEFGTCNPITVLGALRAENAAHHWGSPQTEPYRAAKQRLREAFCPTSRRWRSNAIKQARSLLSACITGCLIATG